MHFYEEPCISGAKGSGTIFFSHCNLSCRFCQNYEISQQHKGKVISPARLIEIMLALQSQGAHNINFVSPTPYTNLLSGVLVEVKQQNQLLIPIVWNSNGYESVNSLELLWGLVDVFMPDLKYWSDERAREFSGAENYFRHASNAILEMRRQVPKDEFEDGLLTKGLIVRHLVLPGQIEDSKMILRWLKDNVGAKTIVSLMSQYYPAFRAGEHPVLKRRVTAEEYREAYDYFLELGFEEGFVQELSSAEAHYTPEFKLDGI